MKARALVYCDDPWHPADTIRQGLAGLGNTFAFEFVEGAFAPLERARDFAITILARANVAAANSDETWLKSESALALREQVQQGHGLLAIHGGVARYDKLPAVNDLLGGAFVRHPDACAITLEPVRTHQVTNGVKTFTVQDEHYFISPLSADVRVILHSRSVHGVQPAGWTRSEGLGRVCVLTPGHNLEVWLHPEFQRLLLNALRWTAKLN